MLEKDEMISGFISVIFQGAISFFFDKMKDSGGHKKRGKVSPLVQSARKIELAAGKGELERELARLKSALDYRGYVEKDSRECQKYIWDQIEVIKNAPKKMKSQQVQRLVEMIYLAYYEEEELRMEDRRKISGKNGRRK